jgi:hypothetical protein
MPEEKYESTYTELVDRIIELAGDRHIVLMSIWPVDDNGRYSGSVKNEWIDKYNDFLYRMAVEKGLYYLDVASILKDGNGSIKREYDSGDGLHYKASAYNDILDYIIHHPVPGVSDEGDFVVHYVKPRGEYKEIMTEEPVLPQTTQVEKADDSLAAPAQVPAASENPAQPPEQGREERREEQHEEQREEQQEERHEEQREEQKEEKHEEQQEDHREEQHEEQHEEKKEEPVTEEKQEESPSQDSGSDTNEITVQENNE